MASDLDCCDSSVPIPAAAASPFGLGLDGANPPIALEARRRIGALVKLTSCKEGLPMQRQVIELSSKLARSLFRPPC